MNLQAFVYGTTGDVAQKTDNSAVVIIVRKVADKLFGRAEPVALDMIFVTDAIADIIGLWNCRSSGDSRL